MNIQEQLYQIQKDIRAPKDKKNNFGNYTYRSAEDILTAVKQVMPKGCSILLSDEVLEISGKLFLKATAQLANTEGKMVQTHAYAGHELEKKGMSFGQVTGAASSYARKYALCGMFAIDDSRLDPDARQQKQSAPQDHSITLKRAIQAVNDCKALGVLETYKKHAQDKLAGAPDLMQEFMKAYDSKALELTENV